MVEERKAYLHSANGRLQKLSFEETLDKHFDDILPAKLSLQSSQSKTPLFGPVVDLANDELKASIEAGYSEFREQMRASLLQAIIDYEEKVKALAKNEVSDAVDELETMRQMGSKAIQQVNENTQASLYFTFNSVYTYQLIALLLFIYICIHSYLYVFARVSFNQRTGMIVTLSDLSPRPYEAANEEYSTAESSVTAHGHELHFSAEQSSRFYISRRFQCRGKAPKLRFVQIGSLPIARLLHGAFTMNEVVLNSDDDHVSCSSTQGIEFFEWRLGAEDRVLFDIRHFVGMSETISLSTLVSPRISSLLLGKILYAQAQGPGTLLLMAKGKAQTSQDNCNTASVPPERIIAMNINSHMHVNSELDLLNVYFSGVHVQQVSGQMLVDVDTQTASKSGLSAFIKHFILPG